MSSPKKRPSKKAAPKAPKKPRAKPQQTKGSEGTAFPSDALGSDQIETSLLDTLTDDERGQFAQDHLERVLADRGRDDTAPDSQEATTDSVSIECAKRETKGRNQHTDSNTRREEQDSQQAGMRKAGTQAESTEQPTTQTETTTTEDTTGDVPLTVAETVAVYADSALESPLFAHARLGESRHTCWERLRKEGRSAGLPKGQGPGTAYEWATREVERLFPAPLPPEPEPVIEAVEPEPLPEPAPPAEPAGTELQASTIVDTPVPDQGVSGLGDIPSAWGELPANAQLQVEIAWVSANRLRVRSGSGVELARALSPAPSYSALSWLETSILFPSKFADISVKATANQDEEKEHVRREKMAIEEIRGLLAEMLEEPN